jgi:predicted enzyme related to lactoylglutathione lyase
MTAPVSVDVNLFCADPERLMAFYRDLLSLPENEAARSPIYRALRLGASELGFNKTDAYALLNLADRTPGDRGIRGFATFGLPAAADVDALAARVPALGGRIVKAPYRTYYGAWQAVAEDPEGNVFRLNHRT